MIFAWNVDGSFSFRYWILQGSTLTLNLRSFCDSSLLSIKPAVRSCVQGSCGVLLLLLCVLVP